ncbi:phosphate-starvation-inducible protein PsiE [Lactobacillus ultunensis]|uniref:Protein PsiE n=1 Tax=Lactobacillus ultunensis DSM 16047 TaxID=525365 RepID=C2ELH2_9LACO|nr:phosphate-starvation-inducible protein PsiE [Lactobacillus ultunensis]EEJ72620.1 protein PsiE [Lactobacillus ultunensis DSM 16047]KRL81239.1 phosphate-starvation-inducible protein PsiE [Lactobacillus ultunensis DSM 16047]QQP28183.1 phosphate-starvation-inducible protein PsiE [Lactobacillus ultunensis]
MKNFNKFVSKFAQFLQKLLVIAIGLLGIVLIILLFRELIPLFKLLFSSSIKESDSTILDEIIVFFLFFEFTAMIISALRHHGHTSINFLMGLGVTALIRGLITAHGNVWEIVATSVSILMLIIAMVIFNKHLKNM